MGAGKKPNYSPSTRLAFLRLFMASISIRLTDVAKTMGLTRQAICHWFAIDDAPVSALIKLISAYGYKLSFEVDIKSPDRYEFVFRSKEMEDPLWSIRRLMNLQSISAKQLNAMLEAKGYTSCQPTLCKWFKAGGGYRISDMLEIAEVLGARLVIRIEPVEDAISA